MGSPTLRIALWVMVAVMLASVFASLPTTQAATPNYTLSGYVDQPGLVAPMKAGVTVELISAATHQVLNATTQSGGYFQYTTASTGGTLSPGWWGLWVPPQAHLTLGANTEWAVLPTSSAPVYRFVSSANLTAGSGFQLTAVAALYQLSGTLQGTVTAPGGGPASGASVALLAPTVTGFDLNSTTTNASGGFTMHVPRGTWVLQSTYQGTQTLYNMSEVTVGASTVTVNPVIRDYLAQGYIYAGSSSNRVPFGGNVTVYDTTTKGIYTTATVPGFYSAATYPGAFVGPGSETFYVLVNPVGYGTVGYMLTVSPTGGTAVRNVNVPALAPPARYLTTLDFSQGFGKVNVSTHASLGNDSVFPDLANASLGNLWAQLGSDFGTTGLGFDASNSAVLNAFQGWLASQGPFFPAGQAGLEVNGTTFGQPTNYTYTAPVIAPFPQTFQTASGISMNWTQAYNATGPLPAGGAARVYTIAFSFRHPVGAQSINYTIDLPAGYTLAANTPKPAYAQVLPAGPGRTYTSFTLVSRAVPAGQPTFGTANFTVVKYSAITAIVNVSVANFAYSTLNVLNSSRANYTAVVGAGQNTTFSAQNSTYPDGTNGTLFQWDFGGASATTTTDVAYHTYSSAGVYRGNVVVTSSGGKTSQANFTVLVGSSAPTAQITSNATASETLVSGGQTYLLVNWSSTLHFNISGSTAPLASNLTERGVLSDAIWSIAAHQYNHTANYSAGSGAKVGSNLTESFLGAGYYFHNVTIGGSPVGFYGWWYNVSLTLWDGQGHHASATLPVLVRDTEKPLPVVTLQSSKGTNVSASGLVESANHTAYVNFNGQYSVDPHNGSIVRYNWSITIKANTTFHLYRDLTGAKWAGWLSPQNTPYTVNLTVWDRAGNSAYATSSLTISVNSSTRPVLVAANLTAPSTMTDGSSYTIWGNVTNTVGRNSTALNVTVRFYLMNPSGTGSQTTIVSPSDVTFYFYTSGVANATAASTGGILPALKWNQTVRAEIHWTPGQTGSYVLYMNATCSNQFGSTGANVASLPVTLNPNPLSTYLEYGVIAAVAVGLIVVLYLVIRRRGRPSAPKSSGSSKSGLERGSSKKDEDDDEET